MEILIFHSHLFELILIPLLGSTKIGAFIGCDLLMLLSNIQLTADVLLLDRLEEIKSGGINIKCKHPIDYLAFIVSLIRILNSNNDDEYRVQMTPS